MAEVLDYQNDWIDLLALPLDLFPYNIAIASSGSMNNLVGHSPAIQALRAEVLCAAKSRAPVLLTGPTGCGKEAAARAIHRHSACYQKPYVAINCGAIPRDLVEAELFGHERGAFTGAAAARLGKLEAVGEGTLLLDELGDMPLEFQLKLLRVIEEHEFSPVGSNRVHAYRGRTIGATHCDLEERIMSGGFREDLFWRLNVISIAIPALVQRREDLGALFNHFLGHGSAPIRLTAGARIIMADHDWPGNVRELRNFTERALALGIDEIDANLAEKLITRRLASSHTLPAGLRLGDQIIEDVCSILFTHVMGHEGFDTVLAKIQNGLVRRALAKHHGVAAKAARSLRISRSTFVERAKKIQNQVPSAALLPVK